MPPAPVGRLGIGDERCAGRFDPSQPRHEISHGPPDLRRQVPQVLDDEIDLGIHRRRFEEVRRGDAESARDLAEHRHARRAVAGLVEGNGALAQRGAGGEVVLGEATLLTKLPDPGGLDCAYYFSQCLGLRASSARGKDTWED